MPICKAHATCPHEARRWAFGAIPFSVPVLAGRLVEASRVPACISKDFARSAQAQSLRDEGLCSRNMEPKRTGTEKGTARLDDLEPLEPYRVTRLVPLEDFPDLHLVIGWDDICGDPVEVELEGVVCEMLQGFGAQGLQLVSDSP